LRICCSSVDFSAKALNIIKSSAPLRPNEAAILCEVTAPIEWQPLASPPHFGILSCCAIFDFKMFDFQFCSLVNLRGKKKTATRLPITDKCGVNIGEFGLKITKSKTGKSPWIPVLTKTVKNYVPDLNFWFSLIQ